MTTTAEQARSYRGLAIPQLRLSTAFPFGAAWAAVAVAIWLPLVASRLLRFVDAPGRQ